MAKNNITQYDATAANNTDIDSINIDEGMAASDVNNAIRSLMSHLKHVATGSQALTALSVAGDLTIAQKIIHSGDTDTHIALADNQIDLTAGDVNIFQGFSNEVVINQGGADVNFRVESNGNANMLVVDGGNDNVGIGTSPSSTRILHVQSNREAFFNTMIDHASSSNNVYCIELFFSGQAPDNTTSQFLRCKDTSQNRFIVLSNGNAQNANNVYGAISDEKLKEQIKDASSQWNDIKALKIRKYKMKEHVAKGDSDEHWRLGVVAQELETAGMGGLVEESPDLDENNKDLGTTTKSVKYSILYMKTVKALQEAMARIETLEAKVTALENA